MASSSERNNSSQGYRSRTEHGRVHRERESADDGKRDDYRSNRGRHGTRMDRSKHSSQSRKNESRMRRSYSRSRSRSGGRHSSDSRHYAAASQRGRGGYSGMADGGRDARPEDRDEYSRRDRVHRRGVTNEGGPSMERWYRDSGRRIRRERNQRLDAGDMGDYSDDSSEDDGWSRTAAKMKAAEERKKAEERKRKAKEAAEKDDNEQAEDLTALGLPTGFGTSKGKKHADASFARLKSKRHYRQYMNRRGGFNRLLAPTQ